MSFELIYKEIGDIGRYQIFVLFLGWMSLVYGGFVWINSVFLLYVPDHRCVTIIVIVFVIFAVMYSEIRLMENVGSKNPVIE